MHYVGVLGGRFAPDFPVIYAGWRIAGAAKWLKPCNIYAIN